MGEGVKGKRSGGGSKLDLVYLFFFCFSIFHSEHRIKVEDFCEELLENFLCQIGKLRIERTI